MTSLRIFLTTLLKGFLRCTFIAYFIFSTHSVYPITKINDQLPIASAGEDGTIQLPNNEVVLNGTGNDPDGGFVTFSWVQISGPSQIIEDSMSGSDLLLSGLIEGIYEFELLVTDDEGNTVKDRVIITVLSEIVSGNQLPTVTIKNPLDGVTATQGDEITLEVLASDTDGVVEKVIFYEEDIIIGEAVQEPYKINWEVNTVGSITISAIAIDNDGGESIESKVNINVRKLGDELPLASTNDDIKLEHPANSALLTGTGYDPDGGEVTVKWTQLYGITEAVLENSTSANTTVNNLQSGEYRFQFTVTDNEGNIASDYITVTVSEENPLITISGERKKWHKVTLEVTGPISSETAETNPFLDYRFDVLFTKGEKSYLIPGYFAADGNAAETSATNGDKWFAHFSPDEIGTWQYRVIFKSGFQAAIAENENSIDAVTNLDGITGTFEVFPSDKVGRDNRAKGRLNYVGKRYLQFEESGEYFLKGGADSPENFLAYEDFDNTNYNKGLIKQWEVHEKDWELGDPTWQNGKGKGIIGALNFLARKEMNVFSFLTMNVNGDDKNVYPYIDYNGNPSPQDDRLRFDCSKLAQWERVFEHAEELGLFMHFKLQEIENNFLLDGGNLGVERKLYLRELVARFGHHLALNWNLGEENVQTDQQVIDMANYLREIDAYNHHLVIHSLRTTQNYNNRYTGLLGEQSELTGASMQITYDEVHSITKLWLENSKASGKQWVIANDEQAPGVPPDNHIPTQENALNYPQSDIRKYVLWGNLMAGGSGVEYYFGYQWRECSDLTCQDFNYYNKLWEETHYALSFFRENIPYYEMENYNELVSNNTDDNSKYCLAKPNEIYVVYYPNTSTTGSIDLSGIENPILQKWFNPRTGNFEGGSILITPKKNTVVGRPPSDAKEDWVAVFEVKNKAEILDIAWSNSISNSTIFQNSSINLSLETTDLMGNIAYIEYEVNEVLIGVSNIAPYNFEWTPTTNGTYALIAKAYNSAGSEIAVSEALKIEVIPSLAPIVNAGRDTTITLPNDNIQLIGTGSDPDGGKVTFEWSVLNGPEGIIIENVNSNTLALSGLLAGEYLFSLKVIDDEGSTSTDEIKLNVLEEPITELPEKVSISWGDSLNDTTILQNSTFHLSLEVTGSQSEITYVEYEVNEVVLGGSKSAPYSFEWTPTTNGTYDLIAKAYNSAGSEIAVSEALKIEVIPSLAPIVNAGKDTTITLPSDSIQLMGTGSDPDGGKVTFEWSVLNGPEEIIIENVNSNTLALSGLLVGEYLFSLKVIDDEGSVSTDEVRVTVLQDPNTILSDKVSISWGNSLNDTTILQNSTFHLSLEVTGSQSEITYVEYEANEVVIRDSKVAPYSFEWTPTTNGTYALIAKAYNSESSEIAVSRTLRVEVIPSLAPIANAGKDTTITLPNDRIQLMGTGSDPDGGEVTFEWSMLNGPEGIIIENVNSNTLKLSSLLAGEYIFSLKVIDDEGSVSTDEIKLNVLEEYVNILPKITILSPTDSLIIQSGEEIPLSAEVSDSLGSIQSVQFYANEELLSTINEPPYLHIWESDFPGFHRITAKALDEEKSVVASKSISIEVVDEPLSLVEISNKNQPFKVVAYPNPVRDKLVLDIDYQFKTPYKVTIYSSDGKLVQELDMEHIPKQKTTITLAFTNTGIYMLHVNIDDSVKVFKLIKH